MKFVVYYNSENLPGVERRLSSALIEHHFSCLSGALAELLGPKGITSTVVIVEEAIGQHALVTLDDEGKGLDLKTILANCLREINLRTPGLCFLGKEI